MLVISNIVESASVNFEYVVSVREFVEAVSSLSLSSSSSSIHHIKAYR